MEFLHILCFILFFLCLLAAVPSLIVWLVFLIRKSRKKIIPMFIFLGIISGIFFFPILGVVTTPTCDHNWETVIKVAATCTENGSTAKICSLCNTEQDEEVIPALGHEWTETVKEATCTESGKRTKRCSVCGEASTEILEAHHEYIETVVSSPKCESDGKAQLTCSVCGDAQEKSIAATGHTWGSETTVTEPTCEKEGKAQLLCTACGKSEYKPIVATGHTWLNATCTAAKTCSVCSTTEGNPIGHTTDAGVCSRCNETVMKKSPVTVVGMRYTIDYVGGVEWTFRIRNNSDKEIKYITFQWSCYNAVGDPIRDEISGKSYVRLQFTGPLAPGETTGKKRNTSRFYNYSYANMVWNEITIEYMDGTIETITEYYEGYYEQ